jgi:nitrite reductase/ring-hydroxylating ferredoxin subunit
VSIGVEDESVEWRDIGDVDAVLIAPMTCVNLGRHSILLARTRRGITALQNVCPHEHRYLHEGELEGDVVVCPGHGWRFDAWTGHGLRPGNAELRRYAVRVDAGRLSIGLPRPGPSKGTA